MVLKAILFTKSASEEEVKSASEGEVTSAILFTKSASEEEVISASEEKVKSAILFTMSATAEVKCYCIRIWNFESMRLRCKDT